MVTLNRDDLLLSAHIARELSLFHLRSIILGLCFNLNPLITVISIKTAMALLNIRGENDRPLVRFNRVDLQWDILHLVLFTGLNILLLSDPVLITVFVVTIFVLKHILTWFSKLD